MKKIYITACVLALSRIASAQTTALFSNGAGLFVAAGTQVQINGDFDNGAGSGLVNNGTISLTGNMINSSPMSAANAGELLFQGTSAQTITGTTLYMTNLTVNNAAGVVFMAPCKVSGQLSFMSGMLNNTDPANAITFTTTASVSSSFPATNENHINGFVIKEGTGPFTFPIGDAQSYQPVGVNLSQNEQGIVAKYEVGDGGDGTFSGTTPLLARNAEEYWTLTPLTSATGSVTIFWDDYKNIGISNINDLRVAHLSNGSWLNEGAVNPTGDIIAGSVTSNEISNWSPLTLGSINLRSPLPVKLISFSARKAEHAAKLNWQIADAADFSHFEIERSADAVHFEKIGQVQYTGDTGPLAQYAFADRSILTEWGTRFYRLKMVDQDGTFAFSRTVSLDFNDSRLHYTAYPNPSEDKLTLKIDGTSSISVDILITSVDGRQVLKSRVNLVKGCAVLDTAQLSAGIYLLFTKVKGETNVIRFAKN